MTTQIDVVDINDNAQDGANTVTEEVKEVVKPKPKPRAKAKAKVQPEPI